jgi:hypothetical protein
LIKRKEKDLPEFWSYRGKKQTSRLLGTIHVYYKGLVSITDCNLNLLWWISFLGLAAVGVILLLKSSLKSFHFVTKINVFDIFTVLFDFGDCVCGCNNFTSCDCWKTPIHQKDKVSTLSPKIDVFDIFTV